MLKAVGVNAEGKREVLGVSVSLSEHEVHWCTCLGVMVRVPAPTPFSPEELESIQSPVLLVLGAKDNLVGDPERAKTLATHIPDLTVEVVQTGHAINVEDPAGTNRLILDFLQEDIDEPSATPFHG